MNKTQQAISTLKERGFTKWKISKLCGVSWQTIHNWERGLFEPKTYRYEALTRILDEK